MPARDASFRFSPFSDKQKLVLTWWLPNSPVHDKDTIICDGSVRAGKTLAMSLAYVQWAMQTFRDEQLGMAGKTIGALRRNVIVPLKKMLKAQGYGVDERRTDSTMTIRSGRTVNTFYLFGGRDESSQELIQGVTLAGFFFDEIALMPQSFVNMATSRCSVDGSRFWMNCNPAGPYHWFKAEWLDRLREKNAIWLHFTMDDNLSLSAATKARYQTLYSGMFYQRYILGRWVAADGLIYDMFDLKANTFTDATTPPALKTTGRRYVLVDKGTQNATVFLECYDDGQTLWITNEYYHSGRTTGKQLEDGQYADAMAVWLGGDRPTAVIVDPSAASFKTTLRHRGYRVRDADNDVMAGIQRVSTLLHNRRVMIHRTKAPNTLKEIAGYVWDPKAVQRGVEQPLKQNDHCMDALRYGAMTIVNSVRASRSAG